MTRGLVLAAMLASAGSCGVVLAQDSPVPDATTPSGPIPGGNPLTPVTPGTFNYQNAPVNNILDAYEQLSGMHLVRDANLTGVPPVSLNATGLTKPEMLKLIKAVLMLNGVSFLPVDARTEKVVTVGTNKNPSSEAPPVFTREVDLPKDDSVVTFYMPLDYIAPQEAVGIFTQTAPTHTYGHYVPAPTAQGLILTEEASVIRELISLKNLIDVPPAKVTTEFVQLNRADSDKIADILNKMLGVGPNGAPVAAAGPGGAVIVPPNLGNIEPMSNEKNLISGPATIVSDPRSNRIVITTRPVNMPFLVQMITQLDQPDIFMVPQRRPLRYVTASDILPALESALAEGKDEIDQAKKDQQTATTQSGRPGQPGTTGTAAPASSAGASSGGSGSSVAAITPQLTTPTENDVPTVLTIGNTRLMADNRSNSIIVFGSPDVVGRVFGMIDQLDRKPLQVYLATVIGELTVKKGVEFGIDILQKFSGNRTGIATSNLNSSVAGSTAAASFFPEPNSLTSAMGFPLPTGLTLYGAIGNTLDAYLRALETTDRFKIISRPSVYTTNNKLAVIASGSQVPVPSSITSGFTGTTDNTGLTTTASVAYEDVLLQLDIIPLINANREVTLQIRQTNNTLGANVDISGNEVPIINTQEINTEITVPDKSTVVIGGLIQDQASRDGSGIPWLSDIPVLGYLFGDVQRDTERDELIIMIQPTVVADDADQIAVDQAEEHRTMLGPDAVEAAACTPIAHIDHMVLPGSSAVPPPSYGCGPQTSPFNSKGIHYTSNATTTITTTTVQQTPAQQLIPIDPGAGAPPVAIPVAPTAPTP